jgi:hypothetical protein
MSIFSNVIWEEVERGQKNTRPTYPIASERLSRLSGYMEDAQNIFIAGRDQVGKSSFMDYNYLIKPFFDYINSNRQDYEPRFIYFSMKQSLKYKFQKWLCLYLKLEFNIVIDLPTLNNTRGKLYDLDNETIQNIRSAESFFRKLEKHMLFLTKNLSPSEIFNKVKQELHNYGSVDENGIYKKSTATNHIKHFIFIDNTDFMNSETDGTDMLRGIFLEKRLGDLLNELKTTYKTTNIIVKPSNLGVPRNVKESEPTFKDLGVLQKYADIGIAIYNPFEMGNKNYGNYPILELVINGKNRFRTITLIKNNMGNSNISFGQIFLGECGYFRDAPSPDQTEKFDEIINILNQT